MLVAKHQQTRITGRVKYRCLRENGVWTVQDLTGHVYFHGSRRACHRAKRDLATKKDAVDLDGHRHSFEVKTGANKSNLAVLETINADLYKSMGKSLLGIE